MPFGHLWNYSVEFSCHQRVPVCREPEQHSIPPTSKDGGRENEPEQCSEDELSSHLHDEQKELLWQQSSAYKSKYCNS